MIGPLGKYSQVVAAAVAVLAIGGAILVHGAIIVLAISVPEGRTAFIDNAALIALGAVFGAVAAVNGVKPDITAAHARLDAIQAPSAHDIITVNGQPKP